MPTPRYAITGPTEYLALSRDYIDRTVRPDHRSIEAALVGLVLPFWVFPQGAIIRSDDAKTHLDPNECLASPEALSILLPGSISPDRLHRAIQELERDGIVRTREVTDGLLAVRHLPYRPSGA